MQYLIGKTNVSIKNKKENLELKISPNPSLSKSGICIPPFGKGRIGGIL
jgi:hypothetical protein